MADRVDYLILGSGISALSFGALMANAGKRVRIIEAHEHFGGFGHSFDYGDYKFNAQLHYVMSCGEGQVVNVFLKRLGLDDAVRFEALDSQGYDRVFCQDQRLNIPYGLDNLRRNMKDVVPSAKVAIDKFVDILQDVHSVRDRLPRHLRQAPRALPKARSYLRLARHARSTLQQVFDFCGLPKTLQTLVAGQLIDLMLPPKQVAFMAWAYLFTQYCRGAYYPEKHFGHVIDSLVDFIKSRGGEVVANEQVVSIAMEGKRVIGAETRQVDPKTGVVSAGPNRTHRGTRVVCNFDPKVAAEMIGLQRFSRYVQRQLTYDYSYSNLVIYMIVDKLDLADHGFGRWNIWHSEVPCLNQAFDDMYQRSDYAKPYFAMNCRSLHTTDTSACPSGKQMLQVATVANYDYWKDLKLRDKGVYNQRKKQVYDQIMTVVERDYVPGLRQHVALKLVGTPTTNERYVWAPRGNSYGRSWDPKNMGASRLLSYTSLENFYFCSAAAGIGGFDGAILNGVRLYEELEKDYLEF